MPGCGLIPVADPWNGAMTQIWHTVPTAGNKPFCHSVTEQFQMAHQGSTLRKVTDKVNYAF